MLLWEGGWTIGGALHESERGKGWGGREFTGHRTLVVAPDSGIQANLGEEEESGRRRRKTRGNRKLSLRGGGR